MTSNPPSGSHKSRRHKLQVVIIALTLAHVQVQLVQPCDKPRHAAERLQQPSGVIAHLLHEVCERAAVIHPALAGQARPVLPDDGGRAGRTVLEAGAHRIDLRELAQHPSDLVWQRLAAGRLQLTIRRSFALRSTGSRRTQGWCSLPQWRVQQRHHELHRQAGRDLRQPRPRHRALLVESAIPLRVSRADHVHAEVTPQPLSARATLFSSRQLWPAISMPHHQV
mmetsp:Transcript_27635/g.46736  ORF Transcript_27635/g.46736 Transcript_27635/m.46736 type:complete len:224 (-) Transcript_27635:16-687(-)